MSSFEQIGRSTGFAGGKLQRLATNVDSEIEIVVSHGRGGSTARPTTRASARLPLPTLGALRRPVSGGFVRVRCQPAPVPAKRAPGPRLLIFGRSARVARAATGAIELSGGRASGFGSARTSDTLE